MKGSEGARAVVIGGTHGMGAATVQMLIADGAHVIATGSDAGNVARAQAEFGPDAVVLRSDVGDIGCIRDLAKAVERNLEAVDAVFVFAAIAEFSPFHEVTEAGFDRQFAINTRGAFFTLQALAPMVRDGGSITITTVTPATASPTMGVYMATKAALRALAQVMAAELLERRVRVNTIAPGFVDTPTLGVAGLTPEARAELHAIGDMVTPMKRHGRMEEVARAALFMAFEATFTTGAEMVVDGGLSTVDNPG
ncbi:MAG: SDR family oxidoreductase [Brevundimonas sp.]|uniref:SDR family oxidoreductase n=1 Tax=Brevundimonas sp. TaxID=1871086 RepID=UPI00391A8A38